MSTTPTTPPSNDPNPGQPEGGDDPNPGGPSGNFTPPATQADLDRIIGERVARERAKYADYADLKDKATKYDEVVEADKTELQKEREAREAAEANAQRLQAAVDIAGWKAEVSKATGVPADVLAGSTKEEIEAHAEVLKPLIAQQAPPADPPVPTVGTTPQTPGNVSIHDQVAAAEAAGNPALVAALKAAQIGTTST